MRIIDRLDAMQGYGILLCDLWGCLHDGRRPFPAAVAALQRFRRSGGRVVLVTNSPKPRRAVAAQLQAMGVPDDCYDLIVSSGDCTQDALARGMIGQRVHHIGPERDAPFFLRDDGSPLPVERVALAEAEGIVCTGLVDDRTETPEDYRATILEGVNRGLAMLCANPDIVVDVGDTRIWCAGALAAAYEKAGGTAHYFGKPHAPIYERVRALVDARGWDGPMLAVGDGIRTDIAGAMGEGIASVFVTGGLAAAETGTPPGGDPDPDRLAAFLRAERLSPDASIGFLR